MIAKHIAMTAARKSSFARLVRYLTDTQQKEERTGEVRVTNCYNDSAEVAALEVRNTQMMNTRSLADKTYHLIISFRSGEEAAPGTLAAIEDRICDGLGFAGHQRVSVVHHDTDNLHLHVAINKIHPTRYTIHERFRAYRALATLCQKLEDEYSLQRDNHIPQQVVAENRAADMEHHAGIESLLGWVKRECKEQMQGAQSWERLHAVLADNGLHLLPRANGLVITSGDGTTIKASSVGREFSKPRLEQRFGPFQPAPESEVARKPARGYEKRKPLASGAETAELYARHRAAQADNRAAGVREREQARARKERRIEAAKHSVHTKRALLKIATMPWLAKKVAYSALTRALHEQIEAIKGLYPREREAINRQHRRRQWADWLRNEADRGDLEALAALRGRHRTCSLTGNTINGPGRMVRATGQDSVTKKGTIVYHYGAGAIRDDGDRLKVSLGADQATVRSALRMAIARYGDRIAVTGSDTFKGQILMVAVDSGLVAVTFAEATLEQRRMQLLCKSRTPKDIGQISSEDSSDPRINKDARHAVTVVGTNESRKRSGPDHGTTAGKIDRHGPTRTCFTVRPGDRSILDDTDKGSEPAGKYIAEREQKRGNGVDVPKHTRYTPLNAGPITYAGTRVVEDHVLVLLRQGDEVMVLEVDDTAARRLNRLPLGAKVSVTAQGIIKTRGRSR